MRNIKAKNLLVAIFIAFILVLIPYKSLSAATIASGYCGGDGPNGRVATGKEPSSNLKWKLNDSGTLTISGSGTMAYFSSSSDYLPGWYPYRDSVQRIVFSGDVTSISNYAFYGCKSLISVTVPDSVKTIGDSAFRSCSMLSSITIPNGVTSIGSEAFNGCSNLKSITIPNSVTSLGSSAFKFCSNLTSVKLSSKIKTIYGGVFQDCTSLSSVTIPEGPTTIESNAFYGCTSLTRVILPYSVTSCSGAFAKCSNLSFVAINKTAASYSSNSIYHYYYFISYSNDGLGTVTGTNKTYGGDEIDLQFTPNSGYSVDKVSWTNSSKTEILTPNANGKYTMPDSDTGVIVSVTFKPQNVIDYGTCGENLSWVLDDTGTLTITGSGNMYNWNDDTVPWVSHRNNIQKLEFSGEITSIGRYAFARCPNLTSVSIPETVKSIGQWAFTFDYGLTNVSIPYGVTDIGWDAFRQCTSLTTLIIPDSVTSIGDCVFYKCTNLKNVTLSNGLDKIDKQFFDGCKNLESVTIPESVTTIGAGAFRDCSKLTSVTIPDSVISIGNEAFKGCDGLTSVVMYHTVYNESAFPGISDEIIKLVYDVSCVSTGNGMVTLSNNKAIAGDEVLLSVTPDLGYEIDTIKVNGAFITDAEFKMPAQNTNVIVSFKKSIFTIRTSVTNGSLYLSKTTANYGDEIVLTATPDAGYKLASIKINGVNLTGNTFLMPSENVTVEAVFEPFISIKDQPSDYVGTVGTTATFSVTAQGENLTYQWQLKKGSSWADLSTGGAKTATMSIKVDASKNGKIYRCMIKDANGEELASNEVSITVAEPTAAITISKQPSNYTGLAGTTATFSVTAQGENLTYQWQLKKGNSWADLSSGGAKTATMSIKVDASKNGKIYRCLISDDAGNQITSNAVNITVTEPAAAITISKQPSNYTGLAGTTATFSVTAQGENLTYQWQLKKGSSWADLSSGGARTATMSIKVDASKNGKVYRCLITDTNGNFVTTEEVSITVSIENTSVPATVTTEMPVGSSSEPASVEPVEITEPVVDSSDSLVKPIESETIHGETTNKETT